MLPEPLIIKMLRHAQVSSSVARYFSSAATPKEREMSFLESVMFNFNKAAPYTGIPQERLLVMQAVDSSLKMSLPLRRDDGSMTYFTAFRAQHSHHRLPTKGGTRFE
jgi:glutamate dehydrogenase (NAD(P)+)